MIGIWQGLLLGYLGVLLTGSILKILIYESQWLNGSQAAGAVIGTGIKYGIILTLLLGGGYFHG